MLSDSARRIDLYDFFSVLLPGIALLLALAPFLPQNTDLGALGTLLPLLVGGFVFGRGIHTLAVTIEDGYELAPTHRERFIQIFTNQEPVIITDATRSAFYRECSNCFDIFHDMDDAPPWNEDNETATKLLEDLYGLVRSYIHIDARGRSRTFQAVYSFYRNMWIVSVIVGGVYLFYGLVKGVGATEGLVNFTSFFGTLGLSPGLIALGSVFVALVSWRLFSEARSDYQDHFVRYLIADFLILQGVDYPEAVIAAEPHREDDRDDP